MQANLAARLEAAAALIEIQRRTTDGSDFRLVEDQLVFASDVGVTRGYKASPLTFTPGKREPPKDPHPVPARGRSGRRCCK